MGFICDDKNKKFTVPYTDRVNRDFEEKMGLSNTIFQDTEFNYCLDPFNKPLYYVSGAVKPTDYVFGSGCTASTGLITATTCNSVYNFSDIDDFDLEFVVTGNTSFTGYTGKFCTAYYKYPFFTFENNSTQILQQPLDVGSNAEIVDCVDYSAMTATTTVNYIKNIKSTDVGLQNFSQWMVRDFNIFESKCDTPEKRSARGLSENFNTWDLSNPVTTSFNMDEDWFFVTLSNPPTPTFFTRAADLNQLHLIQQNLVVEFDGQTDFLINSVPTNGTAIVFVNGATLYQKDVLGDGDYSLDYSNTPDNKVVLKFDESTGGLIKGDLAFITFMNGGDTLNLPANQNSDYFTMESFIVTGITVDYTGVTTGLTSNIINYNTTKGIYEMYLKHNIYPPGNSRADNLSLLISNNGEQYGTQYDYIRSSKQQNQVNFFPQIIIEPNDIITTFYFKEAIEIDAGDLGQLLNNNVSINWDINGGILTPSPSNAIKESKFIIQVTEDIDTSFTGVSYTNVVIYTGQSNTTIFENVTTGKNYIYRVLFIVNYLTLTKDIITVNSISSIGKFGLNNDSAIYGN